MALVTFVQAHDRLPLSADKGPGCDDLAQWCVTQQRLYHRGVLSVPSMLQLEKVPGWSWGPPMSAQPAVSWNDRCAAVAAFQVAHGRLPRRPCDDPVEHSLAVWVANQCQRRQANKLSAVQLEQFNTLTSASPATTAVATTAVPATDATGGGDDVRSAAPG